MTKRYEFEVGDKVVPIHDQAVQRIYTIEIIRTLKDENRAAWVTHRDSSDFGMLVDLEMMKPYVKPYEPGFYQWRGWNGNDEHGNIKWYDCDPTIGRDHYVRVNISVAKEDDV